MATKKRKRGPAKRKKRSPKKRRAVRKRRVVRKRAVKRSRKKGTRKKSTTAHLKKRIRDMASGKLKDGLYLRDKATTRKQHNAAQRKIDAARKDLRIC